MNSLDNSCSLKRDLKDSKITDSSISFDLLNNLSVDSSLFEKEDNAPKSLGELKF